MISLYVNALLCTLQHIVIHAMQLSGVNSERNDNAINGSADPKSRPNARCVTSYDFSTQNVNVQRKFTNKLLLFMVTL